MISEKRIKELIAESLEKVKEFDSSYKKMKIHDSTILLGDKSELESIAFTVFITQLEEKIEAEAGIDYSLDLSEILEGDSKAAKSPDLSLEMMARGISRHLAATPKKS